MTTLKQVESFYKGHKPEPIGPFRLFSVLVPFVEKDGELCIMYEVRNREMETDPGEICFPGGHVEPGEDLLEAALRETEEETGIPRERIRVIGQGDTLIGYANYSLSTFIGIIDWEDFKNAKIEESEVDELFLTPVSHLKAAVVDHYVESVTARVAENFPFDTVGIDKDTYKWRSGKWVIPVSVIDGRAFWGLTLRITEHMMEQLED